MVTPNTGIFQKAKDAKVASENAEKEQRVQTANINSTAVIGEAEANKVKEVEVAEQLAQTEIGKTSAMKEQRIQTANLEAQAVEGENISKANIAEYNATLAVKQADAFREGEVAKANAQRDVLLAQKEQEEAKLKKEELARQEVEKLKIQVQADAEAEKARRIALGEADAIKAKYFAEAEGVKAVLEAKAKGYQDLVKISNNRPEIATSFLMIEKIEKIVEKQVDAIKNIKFDKITVWDGGTGSAKANINAGGFVGATTMAGTSSRNYVGSMAISEAFIAGIVDVTDITAPNGYIGGVAGTLYNAVLSSVVIATSLYPGENAGESYYNATQNFDLGVVAGSYTETITIDTTTKYGGQDSVYEVILGAGYVLLYTMLPLHHTPAAT